MLAAALEEEVESYLARHAKVRDESGRRLVVRNGHCPEREIQTGLGAVSVRRPRVDDRRVDDARGKMGPVVLAELSPDTTDVKPLLDIDGEGVVQNQDPPASLLPRCCSIAATIVFTDCRICFPWFSSAITTP